jgi:hypothetical protein
MEHILRCRAVRQQRHGIGEQDTAMLLVQRLHLLVVQHSRDHTTVFLD